MNKATALAILKRLLRLLPAGYWWLLNQHDPKDHGIAYAFNLPRADVYALLVLSGIGKETARGFGYALNQIEALCNSSDGTIAHDNIRKARFIANTSVPQIYK